MKLLSKLLFVLLLSNSIQAQPDDVTASELNIIQEVVKILEYSHNSNQIWPGYDLMQGPILITFNSGHVFVFNYVSSDPAFQSFIVKDTAVLFSSSDKWGARQVEFNPKFPFEGQSAYLFNLDQALRDPLKPLHILVHERFHLYEFENIRPPALIGNYQDHLNPENLALAKLEEKILADFMQAKGHPVQQREHLRDLLAVNGMRRILIQNPSIAWEDHQQVMEGLADYVGYKMMEVLHPNFDGVKALCYTLNREFENGDYSDHALKWRHYSIGAALGYVLDFLQIPDWKETILDGKASLQGILNDSILMSTREMENRFENIKATYNWNEIFDKVSAAVNRFDEEMRALTDSYSALGGIILSIGDPGTGLSGSGTNQRMLYLHDGTTLSLNDTLKAINEDNQWKLELKQIPFLFKTVDGNMEFKVDPQAEITIDHETQRLNEFISKAHKRNFKKVQIKGKFINFVSSNPAGQLQVTSRGKILIRYE